MIDVRDLKWEVLKQDFNDRLCHWYRVQVSYYDMKFHATITYGMLSEPEFIAHHFLEAQEYVLEEIRHRVKRIRHEMRHETLH